MARINNNDWTDELREMIDGVELSPSEGGWERLKADLHPRRAVWWPYAVPAAACLLLGGVFLFRGRPSGNVLDVAASVPSAMVAEAASVEGEPSLQLEGSRKTSASQTPPQAVPPLTLPPLRAKSPSGVQGGGQVPVEPARSPESLQLSETLMSPIAEEKSQKNASTEENARETTSDSSPAAGETGPLATAVVSDVSTTAETSVETAEEAAPDGPRPVVEEEPALPSLAVQAPSFDIEDEPIARKRGQRRKIIVTVSAGGAFGAAGNGMYIAQADPVTKAGGAVMDITEVIQHSTPVQKALGLSIPISDRMDIATGIDHLELNSVVGYGSQNLEWIGVPLRLGYRVADWGASSINLGAGVKGERCLSAALLGFDYTEQFQWAASMGADYRVRILGPVSLSLTPELSYYFTDTVLPTYRTDHPLTFTLRAGLSLNL